MTKSIVLAASILTLTACSTEPETETTCVLTETETETCLASTTALAPAVEYGIVFEDDLESADALDLWTIGASNEWASISDQMGEAYIFLALNGYFSSENPEDVANFKEHVMFSDVENLFASRTSLGLREGVTHVASMTVLVPYSFCVNRTFEIDMRVEGVYEDSKGEQLVLAEETLTVSNTLVGNDVWQPEIHFTTPTAEGSDVRVTFNVRIADSRDMFNSDPLNSSDQCVGAYADNLIIEAIEE